MLPDRVRGPMPWVWNKRTNEMHDLAHKVMACKLDDLAPEDGRVYEDEVTATTVLKTRHLIPCRFCYRPRGRTTM